MTTDLDQAIRILHLSDIHFRAGKAWDAEPVLRKLNGFIETEVKAGLVPDLVAHHRRFWHCRNRRGVRARPDMAR